jgi:hypothetical protein
MPSALCRYLSTVTRSQRAATKLLSGIAANTARASRRARVSSRNDGTRVRTGGGPSTRGRTPAGHAFGED